MWRLATRHFLPEARRTALRQQNRFYSAFHVFEVGRVLSEDIELNHEISKNMPPPEDINIDEENPPDILSKEHQRNANNETIEGVDDKGSSLYRKVTTDGIHIEAQLATEKAIKRSVNIWLERVMQSPNLSHDIVRIQGDISLKVLSQKAGNICLGVAFSNPTQAHSFTAHNLSRLATVFNTISTPSPLTQNVNGVCLTSGDDPGVPASPFCGGASLSDLKHINSPRGAETFIRQVSNLCDAIRQMPVPVVALINGPCIGAGLEVAASCDIRVATDKAMFCMPEVLLGIPSVVEARLLCDIVGWGRARHLMLTGHTWSATEAHDAGLVTVSFPSTKHMMKWASNYMSQLNQNGSVYRVQKKLMRGWEDRTISQGIEAGVQAFASSFSGHDQVKAMRDTISNYEQQRAEAKRLKQQLGGAKTENKSNNKADKTTKTTKPTEDEGQEHEGTDKVQSPE